MTSPGDIWTFHPCWYRNNPRRFNHRQPTHLARWIILPPWSQEPCCTKSPQPSSTSYSNRGNCSTSSKIQIESTSSVQIHAHANAKWSIGLSKTDHADLQLRYPACTTQTCLCAQIHKYKNANAQIQKRRWGRSMTLIPHPTESTIAAYCAVLCFAKINPIASLFILSAQWATM